MKKKIVLGLAAAGTAVAMIPLFAAFEAHVINVTAKIENALSVPIEPINFGTVFPQEVLLRNVPVALSQSFIDENRVDDVSYVIRQKPKCAITNTNGTVLVGPTATGHVIPTLDDPLTPLIDESNGGTAYTIDCGPAPRTLVGTETWGVLPSLCPYLSKHKEEDQQSQEFQLDAFHVPFTVTNSVVSWLEAKGYLTKATGDTTDTWVLDLAVPCFGGNCAQDWAAHVASINPTAGDPNQWTQPISNEHKVFGCDLWVEVEGVSEATP